MKINYVTEMNVVDVDDVIQGMIAAAQKGVNGTRYILADSEPISMDKIFEIAKKVKPKIEIPAKLSKPELLEIADRMEKEAARTHSVPTIQKNQVNLYYNGINRNYDLSTSKKHLDFSPRSGEIVIEEYFRRCKGLLGFQKNN